MPQSVAAHKALHVATIKRTTPRDSSRGQTAPEAVPGPRDLSSAPQPDAPVARGVLSVLLIYALAWLAFGVIAKLVAP